MSKPLFYDIADLAGALTEYRNSYAPGAFKDELHGTPYSITWLVSCKDQDLVTQIDDIDSTDGRFDLLVNAAAVDFFKNAAEVVPGYIPTARQFQDYRKHVEKYLLRRSLHKAIALDTHGIYVDLHHMSYATIRPSIDVHYVNERVGDIIKNNFESPNKASKRSRRCPEKLVSVEGFKKRLEQYLDVPDVGLEQYMEIPSKLFLPMIDSPSPPHGVSKREILESLCGQWGLDPAMAVRRPVRPRSNRGIPLPSKHRSLDHIPIPSLWSVGNVYVVLDSDLKVKETLYSTHSVNDEHRYNFFGKNTPTATSEVDPVNPAFLPVGFDHPLTEEELEKIVRICDGIESRKCEWYNEYDLEPFEGS